MVIPSCDVIMKADRISLQVSDYLPVTIFLLSHTELAFNQLPITQRHIDKHIAFTIFNPVVSGSHYGLQNLYLIPKPAVIIVHQTLNTFIKAFIKDIVFLDSINVVVMKGFYGLFHSILSITPRITGCQQ